MTTSRLALLLALLLGGMSTVLLLPAQLGAQPVGINLELPEYFGEWYGRDTAVSEQERYVLGAETEFARKTYTNGRGDRIEASIVLSGQDMNTSIHRPERCLPAQGWTISGSTPIGVAVPGFGVVPTTRLQNQRSVVTDNGPVVMHGLNYYWFAGHSDVTASHNFRTYLDIRDRVLHGYNQRWAYITVSSVITKNLNKFGRSPEETARMIEAFIRELVPAVHKDTLRRS